MGAGRPVKKKLLRVAISVCLLGFLAWRMRGDWEKIQDIFAQMRLMYWLLAVGVFLVAQLASSVRWRWLARPLGFEQGPWRFLGYYFVGMFFNLVLPTSVGGDVVRAWYLDGHSGRRLPAFVSVFADRVSGLLVLLIMACVGVIFSPLELHPLVRLSVLGTAGGALLGMAAFGALIYWKRDSIKAWGEGRHKENSGDVATTWTSRLLSKLRRFTLAFSHTLTLYVRYPGMIVGTTILSLIVQAANVLLVGLIGAAIGASVDASYYWILVPMVSLLSVLVPSINGMGVREGGTLLMLTPLGVEPTTGATLGFLWTLAYSAGNLTGVLFYLFGRFERFSAAQAEAEDGAGSESGADPDFLTDDAEAMAKNMEVRPNGLVSHHPDQGRKGQPATAS
jgi:uncharacterized protein (TIRG00374 family)